MQKGALRYTSTQNSLFVIQLIYSLKNNLTAAQTHHITSSNILACVYSHGIKKLYLKNPNQRHAHFLEEVCIICLVEFIKC